jgi:hypothetical protein
MNHVCYAWTALGRLLERWYVNVSASTTTIHDTSTPLSILLTTHNLPSNSTTTIAAQSVRTTSTPVPVLSTQLDRTSVDPSSERTTERTSARTSVQSIQFSPTQTIRQIDDATSMTHTQQTRSTLTTRTDAAASTGEYLAARVGRYDIQGVP